MRHSFYYLTLPGQGHFFMTIEERGSQKTVGSHKGSQLFGVNEPTRSTLLIHKFEVPQNRPPKLHIFYLVPRSRDACSKAQRRRRNEANLNAGYEYMYFDELTDN